MTVHHYGIATKSIEKSVKYFLALGYEKSSLTIFDKIQGVNLQFLKNAHSHCIELVEPVNAESPVSKILATSGTSLYHICYEVEDLVDTIESLKKQRYMLVLPPVPAIAFDKRKICFLYNPSVGLIELLEK